MGREQKIESSGTEVQVVLWKITNLKTYRKGC